jgi:hypothetical protein
MPGDLKQREIAEYISKLLENVRELDGRVSSLEQGPSSGLKDPSVPFAGQSFSLDPQRYDFTLVTSVPTPLTNHFYVRRVYPVSSTGTPTEPTTPWTIDPDLRQIKIYKGDDATPRVGDMVVSFFTGTSGGEHARAIWGGLIDKRVAVLFGNIPGYLKDQIRDHHDTAQFTDGEDFTVETELSSPVPNTKLKIFIDSSDIPFFDRTRKQLVGHDADGMLRWYNVRQC